MNLGRNAATQTATQTATVRSTGVSVTASVVTAETSGKSIIALVLAACAFEIFDPAESSTCVGCFVQAQ